MAPSKVSYVGELHLQSESQSSSLFCGVAHSAVVPGAAPASRHPLLSVLAAIHILLLLRSNCWDRLHALRVKHLIPKGEALAAAEPASAWPLLPAGNLSLPAGLPISGKTGSKHWRRRHCPLKALLFGDFHNVGLTSHKDTHSLGAEHLGAEVLGVLN